MKSNRLSLRLLLFSSLVFGLGSCGSSTDEAAPPIANPGWDQLSWDQNSWS